MELAQGTTSPGDGRLSVQNPPKQGPSLPLLWILPLPPPSPRKTRAPAPASLAGNPGLSNGGGSGGRGVLEECHAQALACSPSVWGQAPQPDSECRDGWGQQGRPAPQDGFPAAGGLSATQVAGLRGSSMGTVRQPMGGWEKKPSLSTGNPQQHRELLLITGEREMAAAWAVHEQKPVSGSEMVSLRVLQYLK